MATFIVSVCFTLWWITTFTTEKLSPKMVSILIVHDNRLTKLHSGKSLLWVAALGLIVIYIYTVGTFVFMPSDFDNQDEGEVVRYCSTLFECSITVLAYGLLDTIEVVSNMAIILVNLLCRFRQWIYLET